MAACWWLLKGFSALSSFSVRVYFCNKSFKNERGNLTENKANKTGKLMKIQPLSVESLSSCPHLPQPRGLRVTEGNSIHCPPQCRVTRCVGTQGETAIRAQSIISKRGWGSFLIGWRGCRLPGSTQGEASKKIPAIV